MSPMKKSKSSNIAVAVLIALLGAALLAAIMNLYLNTAMTKRQDAVSKEKLAYVETMLADMDTTREAEIAAFDELNISKADTVAFMAQSVKDFAMTDAHMEELREIIDVYNLLIIDSKGEIVCSALKSPRDYAINRFNQLRNVWNGSESAEPFTIETEDISLRYYGAKIDDEHMAVIVRDTAVLEEKLTGLASLASTLDGVKVGQEGFVFAVSPLDYTFLYYPEEEYIGKNAVACGIDAAQLEDGTNAYLTISGTRYYCSTAVLDGNYIVCAVPETELTANREVTVIMTAAIYLTAALIMVLYARFSEDDKKSGSEKESRKVLTGRLFIIAVVGVICIWVMTFFVMTLFSLSRQSVTNKHRLNETIQTLEAAEIEKSHIDEQFEESYLEKAHLLGAVIEEMDGQELTRDFMVELAEKLGAERICYFGMDGTAIAASDPFWGLTLSENENDQTYEFRRILQGSTSEIVQEARKGDDGRYCQYLGVAILDENYKTIGLAQIGITPSLLESAHAATNLGDVLSEIQTGNNGFVFAVDSESGLFTYYPDSALIGWEATSYGLKEDQLITGYNDLLTVNNVTYYAISGEYGSNLIYVVVPMNTLNNMSAPIAFVACGFCCLWLLLLWVILSYGMKSEEEPEEAEKEGKKAPAEVIQVDRGDGKKIRTRSILSRFSAKDLAWSEKTAGQKVWFICKIVIGIAAVALLLMLAFADSLFTEDSLAYFILKGTWRKGVNIFAVTQCLILIVAVEVISVLIRRILVWISDKLGARGNTVIRLVISFIRLTTVIGLIYACLAELGADTSVLLTSAGILSLVVGLGANSLIKDMLAGLMIVFEEAFQVGDIVTINGFRGTVVEIGIRTTKVKEAGGNIKIFNNSGVGDVLNMTKDFSVVAVDMSIEYGEDLCYVENILADEFENIKASLPAIKDGPFYKGVSELGDNSVNIKIVAKCNEGDRMQLDRDLRRALKLIFDKYNINIPFPQVVLNQPITEFHHAGLQEQVEAEEFREIQNEESQDVAIEPES